MEQLSKYISYLLRHHPEDIHLTMNTLGYVNVNQLIDHINQYSKFEIDASLLKRIVLEDKKGRYSYNEDKTLIRANQGHTIEYVQLNLKHKEPPHYLYHGTTKKHLEKIKQTGYISKMKRHDVHLSADYHKAYASAKRWKQQEPVVLRINAAKMYKEGHSFKISENDVWFVERVMLDYIKEMEN